MNKFLISLLVLSSSISFAADNNYTVVATGTLASMRRAFESAKKVSLVDLKSSPEKLSCIRYDESRKNEFTQTASAKLSVSEKSAEFNFDGETQVYNLVEKNTDLQALNTALIFDNKIDIFLTVRKTENNDLLIRTAVYQTKPTKTEFTEGIIYKCN